MSDYDHLPLDNVEKIITQEYIFYNVTSATEYKSEDGMGFIFIEYDNGRKTTIRTQSVKRIDYRKGE